MNPLTNYILPIGGMEQGIHRYQFKVDDYFLSHCEDSPYQQADVDAQIIVDRRQGIIVLDVFLTGRISCACDRCMTPIALPLDSAHQVILKVKEGMVKNSTDDVIFIEPDQQQFPIASLLYDLVLLAVPIKKTYACEEEENPPCDFEILDRLDSDTTTEENNGPSIWDDIRKELN